MRDRRFGDSERLEILRAWAAEGDPELAAQINDALTDMERRLPAQRTMRRNRRRSWPLMKDGHEELSTRRPAKARRTWHGALGVCASAWVWRFWPASIIYFSFVQLLRQVLQADGRLDVNSRRAVT